MKQHLKYSKDAEIRGFITNMDYSKTAILNVQNPFNNNFAPDNRPLSAETISGIQNSKDFLYCLANNCRDNYVPDFVNEPQYFPVSKDSINANVGYGTEGNPANDNVTVIGTDVTNLTTPPDKKEDSAIMNSILIGAGVFILLNLFTE
jgi:hypothetical protein